MRFPFQVLALMHAPAKPGLSSPGHQRQPETTRADNSENYPVDKMNESNRNGEEPTNISFNSRSLRDEAEQVSVLPFVKSTTFCLSTRNLEMCTESLGSETGSRISPRMDEYPFHVMERQSCGRMRKAKNQEFCKKIKHGSSFPPPLTSIRGADGIQVQTHREGGRLVIKAFSFSSRCTYFQCERDNGRLRLSLLNDRYWDSDHEVVENKEVQIEEENVDEPKKDGDGSVEEGDFNGLISGENLKEDEGEARCKVVGGEWSSSRCNGDGSGRNRRQICHFVWPFPESFLSLKSWSLGWYLPTLKDGSYYGYEDND